jgi:hypothetical protein
MNYLLFSKKDTFINNHPLLVNRNFGGDEILEIEKTYDRSSLNGTVTASISRALLQFDLSEISQSIVDGDITNPVFTLVLKTIESKEVISEYTIVAEPISESWIRGTGKKYDDYTVEGVSWNYRQAAGLMPWGGTGSFSGSIVSPGGTVTVPTASQAFSYEASDIKMDVTEIVNAWMSGAIPNFGLRLRHSGENDNVDYGILRFFSSKTHTIYSPSLMVSWDDSFYTTGSGSSSLAPITGSNRVVYITNTKPFYRAGEVTKFIVFGREKYPTKTFVKGQSDYLVVKSLPSSSYYRVLDYESREIIFDFSQYTKVSGNESGSYFIFDTTGLAQERYYYIQIGVEELGTFDIYDVCAPFKITR